MNQRDFDFAAALCEATAKCCNNSPDIEAFDISISVTWKDGGHKSFRQTNHMTASCIGTPPGPNIFDGLDKKVKDNDTKQ